MSHSASIFRTTKVKVDADGAPNAYHPDDVGLHCTKGVGFKEFQTRPTRVEPTFSVRRVRSFEVHAKLPSNPGPADRAMIRVEWIQHVVEHPLREVIQADGRIRRWGRIEEKGGRYLRVVLLADGETVHNTFFDRSFKP